MCNGPDVLERQGLELVLLQKVVQILFQHLKDQTSVILMSKTLIGSHEIVLISIFLGQTGQNADLNLALPSITRMIFEDLDRYNFVGAFFPAFGHLTKSSATQKFCKEKFVKIKVVNSYKVQNHNFFTSFSPQFFLTIFLVKSKLSTSKK